MNSPTASLEVVFGKQAYHRGMLEMEREFLATASIQNGDLIERDCPGCGAEDAAHAFTNAPGFSFVRCEECGTHFMNPAPSEGSLTRLYNAPQSSAMWLNKPTDQTFASDPEDFAALVRMAPSAGQQGRLLDVGCATGGFLLTAKQRYSVEGLELSAATADVARKNGFKVTTGKPADLEPSSPFDVITMLQVIEHLLKPEEDLLRLRKVLKPNGSLYLSTPGCESESFDKLREQHTHVNGFGHVTIFSRRGLEKLAARAGFTLVGHEEAGGRDFSLHDLATRRLAPSRFVHRMALYSPRIYYLSNLIEQLLPLQFLERVLDAERQSYQRAILVKTMDAR